MAGWGGSGQACLAPPCEQTPYTWRISLKGRKHRWDECLSALRLEQLAGLNWSWDFAVEWGGWVKLLLSHFQILSLPWHLKVPRANVTLTSK